LQESLQRNIPHVEIHYKTLEKLLRFEKTLLNTIYFQIHLFTEISNVDINLPKNSFTQTIYTTTHFVHTSSVEERPKVVFPTAISVSDSIFQELQNFINLNEEPISV